MSGRNSVVECHLAKVDVDGSNPFARSILNPSGGIAKWLRQRSAKPLFSGSNPDAASIRKGGSNLGLAPFPWVSLHLLTDFTRRKERTAEGFRGEGHCHEGRMIFSGREE